MIPQLDSTSQIQYMYSAGKGQLVRREQRKQSRIKYPNHQSAINHSTRLHQEGRKQIQGIMSNTAKTGKNAESAELEGMRNYLGSTMVNLARVNLEIRTIFVRLIRLGGKDLLKKAVAEKPPMDQVKAIVESITGPPMVNSGTDQVSPNPTSGTTASSSKKRKASDAPTKSKAAKKLIVPKTEEILETDKFSDDDDLEVPFKEGKVKMAEAKKVGRKHVKSIQDNIVNIESD